jgi:L-threonylcarbamoyladenylate synthase
MSNDLQKAANLLLEGNLVAFPTETVYGLGADATSDIACAKIYKTKGRPSNNPLIVHVATIEEARKIAIFHIAAETLAAKFWPGPLTLVLPLKPDVKISEIVTAGLQTIAIRIPSHETALELIRATGKPIAAPSANPSGYVSPTTTSHVRKNFPDLFILEGSNSEYGLESTIIDLTSKPTILRYGFITPESLSEALGRMVIYNHSYEHIKAPGMLAKHYSPRAHVRLNATSLEEGEIGIGFGDTDFDLNLSKSGDLIEAASNLFNMLQIADGQAKQIAIAPIPAEGIGLAINDRLSRAAS